MRVKSLQHLEQYLLRSECSAGVLFIFITITMTGGAFPHCLQTLVFAHRPLLHKSCHHPENVPSRGHLIFKSLYSLRPSPQVDGLYLMGTCPNPAPTCLRNLKFRRFIAWPQLSQGPTVLQLPPPLSPSLSSSSSLDTVAHHCSRWALSSSAFVSPNTGLPNPRS